jgi:hypothetical protein
MSENQTEIAVCMINAYQTGGIDSLQKVPSDFALKIAVAIFRRETIFFNDIDDDNACWKYGSLILERPSQDYYF